MSAEVRDLVDTIIGNNLPKDEYPDSSTSAETVISAQDSLVRQLKVTQRNNQLKTSSYNDLITSDNSVFSRDVNHRISGDSSPNDGVPSRVPPSQPFTLVSATSLDSTGLAATSWWYLAAMILPLISTNNTVLWRCTPSAVLDTAGMLLTHLTQCCVYARRRLRRLAQEQATRDVFAMAMDIILIIYAIGFLIFSFYQTNIFG